MSRVYIGFLAVSLAVAASALSDLSATAQQQPTAIAINTVTTTEIAQSMDETTFKQMLLKNSPWNVTWQGVTNPSRTGTNDMSFAVNANGELSGKLFNFSTPNRDATLKSVSVKSTCVHFTSSDTGTVFKYCVNPDGTLGGELEGTTGWTATAKATPAKVKQ